MSEEWDQIGQGAGGGALTGAGIGAAAGPWGAAVGGLVGGVVGGAAGYLGYQNSRGSYQDRLKEMERRYGRRTAPQMGPAAQGYNSAFRANQAALIAQLEAWSRGEGPSAAQMQMREAADRAAGAQAAAAAGAGGRGVNAGAAYRNAANNSAAIMAQSARDTATLRAQEQFSATQMLAQALAQGRAADEGMYQFNASQQNAVSQGNLAATLSALGINTEAQLRAVLAGLGAAGPGLGTQILAGGAQAAPTMLQRLAASKKPLTGGGTFDDYNRQYESDHPFGQYSRNPDGSSGPVTSPSQVY